jgi:hypothetical protein
VVIHRPVARSAGAPMLHLCNDRTRQNLISDSFRVRGGTPAR